MTAVPLAEKLSARQVGAGQTVTEVEVDEYLTAQRRAQSGFVELSFPTIAGQAFSKSNGNQRS